MTFNELWVGESNLRCPCGDRIAVNLNSAEPLSLVLQHTGHPVWVGNVVDWNQLPSVSIPDHTDLDSLADEFVQGCIDRWHPNKVQSS